MTTVAVRPSLEVIQQGWKVDANLEVLSQANPNEADTLHVLLTAWERLKARDWRQPNSFFAIAGLHGMPWRENFDTPGLKQTDPNVPVFWPGYCQHGNVLFPAWHRAYLDFLEESLQSTLLPTDSLAVRNAYVNLRIAYWDETSPNSIANGAPFALTAKIWQKADGSRVPNPIYSFKFPKSLADINAPSSNQFDTDSPKYAKHIDYETVRYPFSGFVGEPWSEMAKKVNEQYLTWSHKDIVTAFNQNIVAWITGSGKFTRAANTTPISAVELLFELSLLNPSYNTFSNNTSAGGETATQQSQKHALESPHNYIHLAVGGYTPIQDNGAHMGLRPGANGDMGENETAGFDPIFYFHHANVDRVWSLWQGLHPGESLTQNDKDLGLTSAGQGATPGIPSTLKFSVDSPLYPFNHPDKPNQFKAFRDTVKPGSPYGPGSYSDATLESLKNGLPKTFSLVEIPHVPRNLDAGSYVINLHKDDPTKHENHLASVGVFARGASYMCENCKVHTHHHLWVPVNAAPEDLANLKITVANSLYEAGGLRKDVKDLVPASLEAKVKASPIATLSLPHGKIEAYKHS